MVHSCRRKAWTLSYIYELRFDRFSLGAIARRAPLGCRKLHTQALAMLDGARLRGLLILEAHHRRE